MSSLAVPVVPADPHQIVADDLAGTFDPRITMLDGLRNASVTVTGGTGFVGTWLAESVAHLNDQHGFGVSMTLISRSVDRFALEHPNLSTREDIRFVKGDVRHAPDVPRDTTFLFHAAANPDSRFHASRPVETMQTIAEGTASVLHAAKMASDLRMVVHLSSGLVCGPQPLDTEGLAETHNGAPPVNLATSAYAEAKRYSETLCAAVASQDRVPCLTVRPFAFIGPFQSLHTPWAINTFIREAITRGPIRVLGSGRTVRSYLYGSDLAFWLLRVAVAGSAGDCVNVGSPHGIDLEGLARLIARQVDPEPDIVLNFGSGSSRAEGRLVPSVAEAARFGLEVTVPLEEALDRTIRWNRLRQVALS